LSYKTIPLSDFLFHVEEIAAENPSYRIGGSGSDGTCDCIGLIMGAIRRSGGRWPWLHSSNDAARKAVRSLSLIVRASDLSAGDLVFKHLKPGEAGYDLPKRYAGDPDRNDYTHVGVVLSMSPLRIRHMTSPSVKLDTKLGRWSHHGWCVLVRKGGKKPADYPAASDTKDSHTSVSHDDSEKKGGVLLMNESITVEASNGLPVKLRSRPGTSCPLYWEIPSGTPGVLLSSEGDWCRVRAQDIHGLMISGWMKSEFVKGQSVADSGGDSGSAAASANPGNTSGSASASSDLPEPAEASAAGQNPAAATVPHAAVGESPAAASAPSLTAAEAASLRTEAMEMERHLDTIFLILGGRG